MPSPARVTKHFPFIFSATHFLSTICCNTKKRQMYFMCFCQLPFRIEASFRQNILTWLTFLILLSWWKKKFTYLFSLQYNFPRIHKMKLHAGKYLVLFPLLFWAPDDIDLHKWKFVYLLVRQQIINSYCKDINVLFLHLIWPYLES